MAHKNIIHKWASIYGIPPLTVAAVILQESSGDEQAFRYERHWHERLVKMPVQNLGGKVPWGRKRLQRELTLRSCSLGLMQVLGQTAREMGFSGSLWKLYEPEVAIEWGVKILAKKVSIAQRDKTLTERQVLLKGLLFYNGGGDPTYPDRIEKRISNGQARRYLDD